MIVRHANRHEGVQLLAVDMVVDMSVQWAVGPKMVGGIVYEYAGCT